MDINFIKEVCLYLLTNIDNQITLEDLENEFHYNKFYIVRAFKEYTGLTIVDYINCCKVYKSIDPLLFTNDTILKIALTNGFNSLEYYSEKFKNIIGLSPVKFRKNYQEVINSNNINEMKLYKIYLQSLNEQKNKLYNFPKVIEKQNIRKRVA